MRNVTKPKTTYSDEMMCIGCGQKSKGKFQGFSPSEIEEAKKSRDSVFESLGWRKVPGGWKCTNCTGIRGGTAKW